MTSLSIVGLPIFLDYLAHTSENFFLCQLTILRFIYLNSENQEADLQPLIETFESLESEKTICEFIPEKTIHDEFNRKYPKIVAFVNNTAIGMAQNYYSLFEDLGLTIHVVYEDAIKPLAVYDNKGEYCGLVLPTQEGQLSLL